MKDLPTLVKKTELKLREERYVSSGLHCCVLYFEAYKAGNIGIKMLSKNIHSLQNGGYISKEKVAQLETEYGVKLEE